MNNDQYRGYLKGWFSLLDSTIHRHFGLHIKDGMTFSNGPGVYIILRIEIENLKGSIYYIGSSKNVRKRLKGKHDVYDAARKEEDFIELIYVPRFIECDNYIEIESKLIKLFQPEKNKRGKLWH